MTHLHPRPLSLLGSPLLGSRPFAARQHLRRLQDILDLATVQIDLGQAVEVAAAQGVVRAQEGLPDVATGFDREVGVVDRDVDARVESLVDILDSVGG